MDISDPKVGRPGDAILSWQRFVPQSQSLIRSAAFFLSLETSLPFHPALGSSGITDRNGNLIKSLGSLEFTILKCLLNSHNMGD